jgi:murein DD-endopeptidase MepM/ murein hydrolase activator NlpD
MVVVLVAVSCLFIANEARAQVCSGWIEYDDGCVWDGDTNTLTCRSHWEYVDYCDEWGGGGGDGDPGGGGGGGTGSGGLDWDGNGTLDHWRNIVATTDACANNFDSGDRLGSNYGGPGSRPTHPGVDVQANEGDPVYLLRDGRVVFSSFTRGGQWLTDACGVAVEIAHYDGSTTRYCHFNDATVAEGQYLSAGELVGHVDRDWSGSTNGPHVHITHIWPAGAHCEYFTRTDVGPLTQNLNPGGC